LGIEDDSVFVLEFGGSTSLTLVTHCYV